MCSTLCLDKIDYIYTMSKINSYLILFVMHIDKGVFKSVSSDH